jgi:transposase
MDGDLTDAQWALLEPLLPVPPTRGKGGRPRYRSRRELIDGIRWRFRERGRWDRVPDRYGPHQTTYALFYAWRKDGTWERLVSALGAGPEASTIIPWASPAGGAKR